MESTLLILVLAGTCLATTTAVVVSALLHRNSQAQLGLMQDQLAIASDARRSQNMIHALEILRDQNFRSALMAVRNRIKQKPHHLWDAADSLQVLSVCSTYNMLGLMVKQDLVPQQLFLEHWGASVMDSFSALKEFIEDRQKRNPAFCRDFQWLFLQCQVVQVSEAASKEMPMPTAKAGARPTRLGQQI